MPFNAYAQFLEESKKDLAIETEPDVSVNYYYMAALDFFPLIENMKCLELQGFTSFLKQTVEMLLNHVSQLIYVRLHWVASPLICLDIGAILAEE